MQFVLIVVVLISMSLLPAHCFAGTIDDLLISRSKFKLNNIPEARTVDNILILRQRKKLNKRAYLGSASINIEKLLYERTERQMSKESGIIEKFLAKPMTAPLLDFAFISPIAGAVTSGFGWRTHPIFGLKSFHAGIDIAAPDFSPIAAANSGRIVFAGGRSGYGNAVIVSHGVKDNSALSTLYGHLSSILVKNNQFVKKGQIIGLEGSTGNSTGPHLHFEVRENGRPVNPFLFVMI